MSSTAAEPRNVQVDAGGRSLAVHVLGEGEPLVVLEVGLGADSASWNNAALGIAQFTKVCFYDRAGRGASGAAAVPRTPEDVLADLRRVIAAVGSGRPVLFVGQSLGGLIGRLFAHRHPEEAAGLVLVDSLHEDQFETCAPHFPPASEGEAGMLRSMREFWSGGWRDPARNPEHLDLLAFQRAGHAITSLGRLPLRVLTASGFTHPPGVFGASGPGLQSLWQGLHARLASLSSESAQQLLPDCGHFVQVDRPDAVVEAVRRLVVSS